MNRKKRKKFARAKMGGKLGVFARGDPTIAHDHVDRIGIAPKIASDAVANKAYNAGHRVVRDTACSICGGPIAIHGSWKLGNNAQPINNGRCCDKCDKEIVIPARMKSAKEIYDDLRTVEPVWQSMVWQTMGSHESKLEQALLGAGLVKPQGIDPTPKELETLRSFKRGTAFSTKYPDDDDQRAAVRVKRDVDAVREWLHNGNFKLLAPQHPLMHKALETGNFEHINEQGETIAEADKSEIQSILIRHDWAAVLGNAPDTQGDWLPPYHIQCFEFLVEGALHGDREALPVLVFVSTSPHLRALIMLRTFARFWTYDKNYLRFEPNGFGIWATSHPDHGFDDLSALHALVYRQIRAACILLEAKVAETKPLRDMGYKRNVPPSNSDVPLPKLGYSIVELADRHRVERLPLGLIIPSTRRRPRLHFRCAHWRHFANHRTRIPWTLAGNPDLGFVEKEYRL